MGQDAGAVCRCLLGVFSEFQKHLAKNSFCLFDYFYFVRYFVLINKGLALMRVSVFKEDFLLRAKSIYDLNDASNVGRIKFGKKFSFGIKHPLGLGLVILLCLWIRRARRITNRRPAKLISGIICPNVMWRA